ncbi:12235_t:CDS:2 [Funneliformis mosseae]|uniref:12235_t:CDS:1 n=1 Tax=Funneliformis mosseae TaxID=27381 RepID=A0A9N9GYK8_FUNMO|nr:12235_t:CDS:2 [Funneliformis mosseae]
MSSYSLFRVLSPSRASPTLNPKRYMADITLYCYLLGTPINSSIPVDIGEMTRVEGVDVPIEKFSFGHLKKQIWPNNNEANKLRLWKFETPFKKDNEDLKRFNENFCNDTDLEQELGEDLSPEPPMKKRRLWKIDPKGISVIQSNNEVQQVSVSESEFQRMRMYHQLYVDKTCWLTRLRLNNGQYFVSRPRKFGKSMFLSMVESFYLVQYNLFENLYIRDHPPNIFVNNKTERWNENLPPIPVIRLDFSLLTSDKGSEMLENDLIRVLQSVGEQYGIDTVNDNVKSATFKLIKSLADDNENKYGQVVILIDEYDSPLLNVIGITKESTYIANDSHGVLKSFFEVIKALQSKIKFLLVTGVTMFAHLGLFSGLNNLKDVTLSNELSGAYGFTSDEITKVFGDKLLNLGKSDRYNDVQDVMNKLQKKYNGYSWDGNIKVYNPYSICSFFENFEYENFWIQKGKTKFLARLIGTEHVKNIVDQITIKKRLVVPVDVDDIQKSSDLPASLLFQTGYLTIKQQKIDDDDEQCLVLEIPNAEVKESLMSELWACLYNTSIETACKRIYTLAKLLKNDNCIKFMRAFNDDLASIPYNESQHAGDYEGYYHSRVHMLVRYIGLPFRSEDATSQGRTDMWIMTNMSVYYLEYKRCIPPKTSNDQVIRNLIQEAIEQIFTNEYYSCHTEFHDKSLYAVGCVFSTGTRKICGVGIQEFTYGSNKLEKMEIQNFLDEFS